MKEMISFVENKQYDFDRIQSLLSLSISQNHHSNFGPVSTMLETALGELNGINLERKLRSVCCGSSATVLINAVVCALDNVYAKELKWVCSDFGFFTNYIGGLKNSIKIPCNHQGMLCLNSLSQLDINSFDAIVVTNIFGLFSDFRDYINFAIEHDKILLIDNAAGFGALSSVYNEESLLNTSLNNIIEVISLHHTKPWGIGEGGALFACPELIEYARASINFGIKGKGFLRDNLWCSNGKMSEISAAAILARVENHATWRKGYLEQTKRIFRILNTMKITPLLSQVPTSHVVGQLAYLLNVPLSRERLRELTGLPLEKYYRPTDNFGERAMDIHARIVNIPCHPGMGIYTDDELVSKFANLERYVQK